MDKDLFDERGSSNIPGLQDKCFIIFSSHLLRQILLGLFSVSKLVSDVDNTEPRNDFQIERCYHATLPSYNSVTLLCMGIYVSLYFT